MTDQNLNNNQNKTPSKMARLAWPKAKYGVILAFILIIIVNAFIIKISFYHFLNKIVLR